MKRIEMIVRPEKLEEIKDALDRIGIGGMTVSSVLGCGVQKGRLEMYRGSELPIMLLQKIKIEMVVKDEKVEQIISEVRKVVPTGSSGDGKLFVSEIAEAVRLRTGERGDAAL